MVPTQVRITKLYQEILKKASFNKSAIILLVLIIDKMNHLSGANKSKRTQTISFLVLFIAVFVLVLWMFKSFVNLIALAVILTILFRPFYRWLLKFVKRPWLASSLTVLTILLILLIPIVFFGQLIFNETIQLYESYRSGGFVIDKHEIVSGLPDQLQNIIFNISTDVNSLIGKLSSQAFTSLSGVISNIAGFIVSAFMLFFIVYYLLKDGTQIKKIIMDVSPISSEHEDKIFSKVVSAVNGVVKGSFLVALLQASIATIGFFIFGVPEPVLWGGATIITSLVPNVGTALSVTPAVIFLAVTGHIPQAIGLAIWGAVAVGLADNVLSPRLVAGAVRLHPILVLLAVLGGIKFFGMLGFLIGPIFMAVFVALVDLYRTDFKEYLQN